MLLAKMVTVRRPSLAADTRLPPVSTTSTQMSLLAVGAGSAVMVKLKGLWFSSRTCWS